MHRWMSIPLQKVMTWNEKTGVVHDPSSFYYKTLFSVTQFYSIRHCRQEESTKHSKRILSIGYLLSQDSTIFYLNFPPSHHHAPALWAYSDLQSLEKRTFLSLFLLRFIFDHFPILPLPPKMSICTQNYTTSCHRLYRVFY